VDGDENGAALGAGLALGALLALAACCSLAKACLRKLFCCGFGDYDGEMAGGMAGSWDVGRINGGGAGYGRGVFSRGGPGGVNGNWGDASNAANDYDYTGYGAPNLTCPTMGPSSPTFGGVGSGRVFPSSPTFGGGGDVGNGLYPAPSFPEGVLSPPRLKTPTAPPLQAGVDDERTNAAIEASRQRHDWDASAVESGLPVAKPVPD